MKRQLLKLPTLFAIIAGTVIFAIGIPKATKTDRHTIQTLPPEELTKSASAAIRKPINNLVCLKLTTQYKGGELKDLLIRFRT